MRHQIYVQVQEQLLQPRQDVVAQRPAPGAGQQQVPSHCSWQRRGAPFQRTDYCALRNRSRQRCHSYLPRACERKRARPRALPRVLPIFVLRIAFLVSVTLSARASICFISVRIRDEAYLSSTLRLAVGQAVVAFPAASCGRSLAAGRLCGQISAYAPPHR